MDSGNRLRAANGDRFTYNDRDHIVAGEGAAGTSPYHYDALDMLFRCCISGRGRQATMLYAGGSAIPGASRRPISTGTTFAWLGGAARRFSPHRMSTKTIGLVPFLFVDYTGSRRGPWRGKTLLHLYKSDRCAPSGGRRCGTAAWRARIDPYGQAQRQPWKQLEMPLRFPGHYHDQATVFTTTAFAISARSWGATCSRTPLDLLAGSTCMPIRSTRSRMLILMAWGRKVQPRRPRPRLQQLPKERPPSAHIRSRGTSLP